MNRHDIRPGFAPAGHYAFRAGTAVQVQHCARSYPLPTGLVPGEWVKVLKFDAGYYSVAKPGGQTFSVFMANIVQTPRASSTARTSATANRRSHSALPAL